MPPALRHLTLLVVVLTSLCLSLMLYQQHTLLQECRVGLVGFFTAAESHWGSP